MCETRDRSKGRVQGVRTPPPEIKPSSYALLNFVCLVILRGAPLLRKVLDLPLETRIIAKKQVCENHKI